MKLKIDDIDRFRFYSYEEMLSRDNSFGDDMGKMAYDILCKVVFGRFKKVAIENKVESVASQSIDFRNPTQLPKLTAAILSGKQVREA